MRKVKVWTKVEYPAPVRVLIPYVKADHRLQFVVDCLRIQYVQPELHQVDDGDAYWRLLKGAWDEGVEFFVVEQDVAVWPGSIAMLSGCDQDWCTLPTMCHGRYVSTTLGCVKFGKKLIEQNPGFWDDIPTTWFHLDANFADKMGWPFIRPHTHTPAATHLNEVQWPDDISTRFSLSRKIVWQSMEQGGIPVVRVNYRVEGDGRKAERVAVGDVHRD